MENTRRQGGPQLKIRLKKEVGENQKRTAGVETTRKGGLTRRVLGGEVVKIFDVCDEAPEKTLPKALGGGGRKHGQKKTREEKIQRKRVIQERYGGQRRGKGGHRPKGA